MYDLIVCLDCHKKELVYVDNDPRYKEEPTCPHCCPHCESKNVEVW